MNLFLIVYERDGSCDWFFFTSEKDYLKETDHEVRQLIADNYEIDLSEFDRYIGDCWVNKVDGADGYKVKLVKA